MPYKNLEASKDLTFPALAIASVSSELLELFLVVADVKVWSLDVSDNCRRPFKSFHSAAKLISSTEPMFFSDKKSFKNFGTSILTWILWLVDKFSDGPMRARHFKWKGQRHLSFKMPIMVPLYIIMPFSMVPWVPFHHIPSSTSKALYNLTIV